MADGVDPDKMIVSGLMQHRLGHLADGACVFLDPAGRCRIHAKFGEAAKPLACRLYPLVIHPAGKTGHETPAKLAGTKRRPARWIGR